MRVAVRRRVRARVRPVSLLEQPGFKVLTASQMCAWACCDDVADLGLGGNCFPRKLLSEKIRDDASAERQSTAARSVR